MTRNLVCALVVILVIAGVALCAPTLSVFAGSPPNAGFVNAVGTAARFYYPVEMKGHGHPQGNIHIADRSNQALRYLDITTQQVTTRYTGAPVSSVSNMDPNGNVYFGEDGGNKRIWKITSAGVVTVLGYFTWFQYGMFFNNVDGFLYCSGYDINKVLKVNVNNGAYSVYAGSTYGQNSHNVYRTSAQYGHPLGCGGAANGDFYFSQFTSQVANKIDYNTGMSTIVAGVPNSGGYSDGAALSSRFYNPYSLDVTCDGQHVYISDSNNNRIRRVTAGTTTTVAGTGAATTVDGPALSASINFPWGISAHVAGKVFFLEYAGQVVRLLTEQVHTQSCTYANYCCAPVYAECAAIHASCTAMDLTPLQQACQADTALCGVYNLAVAVKNSCNRLGSDCDALINGC